MRPSSSSNARVFWSRFSKEVGAEHICAGLPYWSNNDDKVIYTHNELKITLDCYTHTTIKNIYTSTRIYAPVIVRENFRFSIYPGNFIEEIAKFFGMQDVECGDKVFDEKLIIKTDNEEKLKLFLSNPKIRELISTVVLNGHFNSNFVLDRIRVGAPDKGKYLSFIEPGVIYDVERLKTIFRLLVESLKHLKYLGLTIEAR